MKTTIEIELDVDTPEKVGEALRAIAGALEAASAKYAEAHGELSAAWTDPSAGRVWDRLAKRAKGAATLLRKQAEACEHSVARYV